MDPVCTHHLRLGFELFFLVPRTYDFASITIASIQLPPSILVTLWLWIVSFLFWSLVHPPRPHYRSFNNTPFPSTRAMVVCYCVISVTSHHGVTEITQSRTAVALAAILSHNCAVDPRLHDAHQGKMKRFHILFYIYWLYQVILNLVYRWFIKTLTNSIRNIVRKLAVTKCLDRLVTLDCVRPKNLTESTYSYK